MYMTIHNPDIQYASTGCGPTPGHTRIVTQTATKSDSPTPPVQSANSESDVTRPPCPFQPVHALQKWFISADPMGGRLS